MTDDAVPADTEDDTSFDDECDTCDGFGFVTVEQSGGGEWKENCSACGSETVPADTLPDRLRERYKAWPSLVHASGGEHGRFMLEAADEIERLRADNERLRAALEEIAGVDQLPPVDRLTDGNNRYDFRLGQLSAARLARSALEGPTDDR